MNKKPLPPTSLLHELFTYKDGRLYRATARNRWAAGEPVGHTNRYGYRVVKVKQAAFYEHRLVYAMLVGGADALDIDHINGDRADNRIENLRAVTRADNCKNQRRARIDNRLGVLGVHKHSSGKYVAQIMIGDTYTYLGSYDNVDAAAQAYLAAKREHHATCTL